MKLHMAFILMYTLYFYKINFKYMIFIIGNIHISILYSVLNVCDY